MDNYVTPRILESIYSETLSAGRVNESMTEWFATMVGVLHIVTTLIHHIS